MSTGQAICWDLNVLEKPYIYGFKPCMYVVHARFQACFEPKNVTEIGR